MKISKNRDRSSGKGPEKTTRAAEENRGYGGYGSRSSVLTVAEAYSGHQEEATERTLNVLFRAISRYSSRLASLHLEPQDREDAAQEAVVYCWRHLGKFDPNRGKFQQWVLAKVLASFSSFRRAKRTQKRGGGWHMVSLVIEDVDACYQ